MKEIIQGFYQKKHFWTRLILVIAAVILMGFALSWLLLVDLGTDPCTLLNQTISTRLGISIGNWQALFNTVLLIFVIIFGGRNLGFGTLANMFLVGYSIVLFLLDLGESPSGRPLHLDGCANRRADPGAGPVYPCRILLYGC
mgnify:FL=1